MKTSDILILGGVGLAGIFIVPKLLLKQNDGGGGGGFKVITETIPSYITQYIPQPSTGTVPGSNWFEDFLAWFNAQKGDSGDIIKVPNVENIIDDVVDKVTEVTEVIPKPDIEQGSPEWYAGILNILGLSDFKLFELGKDKLFDIDVGFKFKWTPELDIDKAWANWSDYITGWQDEPNFWTKLFGWYPDIGWWEATGKEPPSYPLTKDNKGFYAIGGTEVPYISRTVYGGVEPAPVPYEPSKKKYVDEPYEPEGGWYNPPPIG